MQNPEYEAVQILILLSSIQENIGKFYKYLPSVVPYLFKIALIRDCLYFKRTYSRLPLIEIALSIPKSVQQQVLNCICMLCIANVFKMMKWQKRCRYRYPVPVLYSVYLYYFIQRSFLISTEANVAHCEFELTFARSIFKHGRSTRYLPTLFNEHFKTKFVLIFGPWQESRILCGTVYILSRYFTNLKLRTYIRKFE